MMSCALSLISSFLWTSQPSGNRIPGVVEGTGGWCSIQTARALSLGVPVTIIAVMMRTNYDKLPEIGTLAAWHGVNFRVNVYQPVKTDAFSLDYEQFWAGFQRLLESCPLAVCNEPIVRAILGFRSLRLSR